MSNKVLDRYSRRVMPANATDTIIKEYREHLAKDQSGIRIVKSPTAGDVVLFQWGKYPQFVLEIVIGAKGEDCAIALYHHESLFDDVGEYERCRWELISEIAGIYSALPSSIRFDDGRDRKNLQMKEMATAQLIDNLARMTYSSI